MNCHYCNAVGEKETADMIKPSVNIKDSVRNPEHLVLLCPNEKMICNTCLRILVSKVPVGQK